MKASLDVIKKHPDYKFFVACNIPILFIMDDIKDYTCEAFLETQHYEDNKRSFQKFCKYCDEMVEMINKGFGLFINGSYGVGKTMLITIATHKFMGCHNTLYNKIEFITGATLVKLLMGFDLSDEEKERRERIDGCRLLVIDDIGKVCMTKNAREMMLLENVLRERYLAMRPCFITSQGDIKDLSGMSMGVSEILKEAYVNITIKGSSCRDLTEAGE